MTSEDVRGWLEEVKDPEIPVLSLIDLGVITSVSIANQEVNVEMTPTFVGCPAMDYMRKEVEEVLARHGIRHFSVNVNLQQPWTSDKLTEKGKEALRKFGLAPPPHLGGLIPDIEMLEHAECPRCRGTNTEMKSPFGPTLCRSLHYCNDCKEAFEQFKPL